MMRALWSAASGMVAQQTNVDTISNNLANVNTTGYKTEVAEFKSLLYQNMQTRTTSANGEEKPISAQVGLGVRNSSITSIFTQGAMTETKNETDFAISGKGFFAVRGEDGETNYTRNGDFGYAVGPNGMMLTNSDGLPVLNTQGQPIVFAANIETSELIVSSNGEFMYPDANGNPQALGQTIGLFQFSNPAGLEKTSGSLLLETEASGAAINEANNENVTKSSLAQGYLEASNVQVVDEMVNLIVAQRAYEMNSKAIQASDEMLGQANNLRR